MAIQYIISKNKYENISEAEMKKAEIALNSHDFGYIEENLKQDILKKCFVCKNTFYISKDKKKCFKLDSYKLDSYEIDYLTCNNYVIKDIIK